MTESEASSESSSPKPAGLVDLSDLRMMPAWVSGMGQSSNLNKYEGREERAPRREGFGDRRGGPPSRRDGGGFSGRGDSRPRGDRDRRDGPSGRGGKPGPGGPRRGNDDERGPRRFGDRPPQREWVAIPKDVQVTIEPEDKSVEALAQHIRSSGHAFSMFDAARLVLADGERFHARFVCATERPSGLFAVADGGGLFLTAEEGLQSVLRGPALEAYYRVEDVELEAPKGDFKSVGVCGLSGELIGPPNHHSFQTTLLRLHRERFSHLPLEDYKRRVRVEANPELVEQWREAQRKGRRWISLKVAEGEEPAVFNSRAEMEAHFRRTHGAEVVKETREAVILGNLDKSKLSHVLFILLRQAVEAARKHLFELSQKLGSGFERRGLKLFKRRAGKLFVCRVKPRAIDPGVVFSERVARIVELLKAAAGMPLTQLVEKLVPQSTTATAPAEPAAPVEAAETGEVSDVPAETTAGEAKSALNEEQIAVLKDIRWLVNEGYVIEYSDGMVFLGVQGEPQPAKAKAETAVQAEKPAESSEVTAEKAPEPSVEVVSEEVSETPVAGAPASDVSATTEVVETELPTQPETPPTPEN